MKQIGSGISLTPSASRNDSLIHPSSTDLYWERSALIAAGLPEMPCVDEATGRYALHRKLRKDHHQTQIGQVTECDSSDIKKE